MKATPEPIDTTISLKTTSSLNEALEAEATARLISKSELIRQVLSSFLSHLNKENA
jgi:hypothetical protein